MDIKITKNVCLVCGRKLDKPGCSCMDEPLFSRDAIALIDLDYHDDSRDVVKLSPSTQRT